MHNSSYIHNLITNFLTSDISAEQQIMFINHFNSLDLRLEDIEKGINPEFKKGLLYHRYSRNDIKEPYEPLLSSVRYYYQKLFSKKMTPEEFVDECNVYSLHKPIFTSYIRNGEAKRSEPIINPEASYEHNRFTISLANCLKYIANDTNLFIVLDQFQFAAYSTIKLLNKFMEQITMDHIRLLIIYDESVNPSSYIEEEFKKIIEYAEKNNMLFEWESDNKVKSTIFHSVFMPAKRYFKIYLKALENLNVTLCLEDAEYFLEIIYNRILEEKMNLEDSDKFKLFSLRARNAILRGDVKTAMIMSEKMFPIIKDDDYRSRFEYYNVCCKSQMMLVQSDLSIKYAQDCLNIAKKIGDEELIFKAEVLIILSQYGGWRDIFSVDFDKAVIDDNMINKLREHNYLNTLAYYIIFGFDNDADSIDKIANGYESEYFNQGIKIGMDLDNTNFLLSAYTKYIVLSSERGYNRICERFYKEKLKILEKENNKVRKTHLYLGMGYNSIVAEQYLKANEYIITGIKLMYELKDAEGICEALYNISVNSMCAQDFKSAEIYLDTMFKMLDNLNLETIQICNSSKLYGMLSFCSYMNGNEYKCFKTLSKVELLVRHLIDPDEDREQDFYKWHEDLFLYYFINGIIQKNNNDLEMAKENFDQACLHYYNNRNALFYMAVNFTYEMYDYYMRINEKEEARNVVVKCIDYCKSNGYLNQINNINQIINGKPINVKQMMLNSDAISLENLIELSYNVGKEKQLEERKRDINFLSSLQEMTNRDNMKEKEMVDNVMTAVQNNFNLDGMILLRIKKGKITELYRDGVEDISQSYTELISFFNLIKREFMISRTDKSFFDFDKVVSLFGRNKVVTLIGIPVMNYKGLQMIFIGNVYMHRNFRRNRILLNEDDLAIIKTAINQLSNGLERIRNKQNIIEINEKLNVIAITDSLTGLYNRQGLKKMIDEHTEESDSITIIYADLDNFKYYNDTFGHDLGDRVLVEFAQLFEKMVGDKGFTVRYGGDEFLMVFFNTDYETIKSVVEEIYEAIKDGLKEVVYNYVKKKVDIPLDKRVSCSMGIATSENMDFQDTLKKADIALYKMKKGSKGNYILYDDIEWS